MRRDEYVTYAPAGEKCVACCEQIKSLERVWRCTVEGQPRLPARASYRHYEKCRKSTRTLGDLFGSFEREAFRLEMLDDYSRSGNVDAYRAFQAGRPQPEDYNADWVAELRSHTGRGKRVYRVHVLARPLTEYLRFELGWGYRRNMTGGEEFFILDVTDAPHPLEDVPDFWLFDSEHPAVMGYDEQGAFQGADVLPATEAERFVGYREAALAHAEPFTDWWTKYGD